MPVCAVCGTESAAAARYCPSCGTALEQDATARETRRTVTVLFSDIVDSTAITEQLDPEASRRLQSRYFGAVARALERHGGTVEKYIGDAVMAVFGVPRAAEDDALRAVRAAAQLQGALEELNEEIEATFGIRIRTRTGINTGEVVAGDGTGGQRLATGDAVVVARRLEQAAGPDEILLGRPTFRLVQDAVDAEPVGPVAAKGKAEGIPAWRVRRVDEHGPGLARRLDVPLVDRKRERSFLDEALLRAEVEQECQLVTIVGAAGVGKTRLTAEFAAQVGERAAVLEGRCLPYGEGITYWPLQEIVRRAAGILDEDSRELAAGKLRQLLPDDTSAPLVCSRLAGVLGLAEEQASAEETFWGVRKLLEALAAARPLVLVVQDLHWAEPTLLDLVEYLSLWSKGVPLVLVCLARPELFELRPAFASGIPNARSLALAPLMAEDVELLIHRLLGDTPLVEPARDRIARTAEGNPLFVEELLRMLVEDRLVERQGDQWSVRTALDDVAMPPTIQSLLAARLDRLDDQERAIVQRASIAGKVFWWGAVVELSPQEARAEVGARLQTLVRKQLIEPEQAGFDGEDAFRFAHILIRDAAYAAIPKAVRAELHERYAGWLERRAGDRLSELEEVVGYHLELAIRYREELGTAGVHERELALRAGGLLGAAGRRAFRREDMPAALKLLDRAVALLTDRDPARLELMRELSFALWSVGELARAETLLNGLVEAAVATGDRRIEWYALLERAGRGTDLGTDPDELLQTARKAIEVFEELGDDLGLARAWRRVATAQQMSGRFGPGADAGERARRYAHRADDAQEESRIVDRLCTSLLFGPAPAEDAAARCRELLERARNSPLLEANVRSSLAALVGITGDLDEARRQYRRAYELYEELGLRLPLAGLSQLVGSLELAAGDAEAAERELRRGYEILEPVGATSTQAALLAQTLYVQGRYRESEAALGAATGRGIQCRIVAGGVKAKLAAQRGDLDAALELAQEALAVADETDSPALQADALLDLGEVQHLTGDPAAARGAYAAAQRLFGAKGHALGTRQVEARLRALTA